VPTLWVAPPKMFYNWHRIWWSRYQLWNCTHFRHPTDEQLRQLDTYRSRTSDCGLFSSNIRWQYVWWRRTAAFGLSWCKIPRPHDNNRSREFEPKELVERKSKGVLYNRQKAATSETMSFSDRRLKLQHEQLIWLSFKIPVHWSSRKLLTAKSTIYCKEL